MIQSHLTMRRNYSLAWQSFSEHFQVLFRELYEDQQYSDVTLVSGDKTQFKAHKIVLSAASSVLKTIIDGNPSQNPLIYLRGIGSQELESILQFIYLGEATFSYEKIEEFIRVAQDLEVKEIANGMETADGSDQEKQATDERSDSGKDELIPDSSEKEPADEGKINYPCSQCEYKASTERGLMRHTEFVHQDLAVKEITNGMKISEGKGSDQEEQRLDSLKEEPISDFTEKEKLTYPCDQCDYKGSISPSALQRHIEFVHQGRRFQCEECDYQVVSKSLLKAHIRLVHLNIVDFSCDQCDYQATTKFHLRAHVKGKHVNAKISCQLCSFKTSYRGTLWRHMKTKHDEKSQVSL